MSFALLNDEVVKRGEETLERILAYHTVKDLTNIDAVIILEVYRIGRNQIKRERALEEQRRAGDRGI